MQEVTLEIGDDFPLCEVFGKAKFTISEHIKAIFEEGESDERVVVRKYRTTTKSSKSNWKKHKALKHWKKI